MAEQIEKHGRRCRRRRTAMTAGNYYIRAGNYYFTGRAPVPPGDRRSSLCIARLCAAFMQASSGAIRKSSVSTCRTRTHRYRLIS